MAEYDTDKYDLPSDQADNGKLNKLRAAVLGANDGIVSTSSVVMGVAGATSDHKAIATAGLAALVAGALSMAVGEYVSVSSQSDAEKAYIRVEEEDLRDNPEMELDELAREYQKQGVSRATSLKVAKELTEKDALRAHLRVHFNIDPDDINSPTHAAIASLLAFTVGGIIPFATIILVPEAWRIGATVGAVVVALLLTGYFSAAAGNASHTRAITRVLAGGLAAMAITYWVGVLFGTTIK
jgi:VIT1/CCC1 family predicted Fe2+/Mn2+ transporter